MLNQLNRAMVYFGYTNFLFLALMVLQNFKHMRVISKLCVTQSTNNAQRLLLYSRDTGYFSIKDKSFIIVLECYSGKLVWILQENVLHNGKDGSLLSLLYNGCSKLRSGLLCVLGGLSIRLSAFFVVATKTKHQSFIHLFVSWNILSGSLWMSFSF